MAIGRAVVRDIADNWWVVLLRGIVAVLFAVVAFALPGATLLALVLVWGAFALVSGVFALYLTYKAAQQRQTWWPYLLDGIVGIAAGIVAFVWPGITALALLYVIAFWAILTGIFQIVAAINLRKQIEGEWLMVLSGALGVIFGILVAIQPDAGAVAVVWILGFYALLAGITWIALAFRLRGLGKEIQESEQRRAAA